MKDVGVSFVSPIMDSLLATLTLELPRKIQEGLNRYGYEPNKSCSLSFLALFVLSTSESVAVPAYVHQ